MKTSSKADLSKTNAPKIKKKDDEKCFGACFYFAIFLTFPYKFCYPNHPHELTSFQNIHCIFNVA